MKRAATVFLLLLLAMPALAQTPKPATPPPNKAEKIRKLLALTGAVNLGIDMMKRQMDMVKRTLPIPAKAQDDFAADFLAAVTPEEFTRVLIPVYDKNLTEEDLDSLIAFNETPFGQRMAKVLPTIAAEAASAGQEWGGRIGNEIGTKIGSRLMKGEYGPWPPAAPAQPPQPK